MIKKYASNSLSHLLATFIKDQSNSKADLFSKTVVITQTAGMNAWLKTEIPRVNGIFANFQFLNQDGLLTEIHKALFNEPISSDLDFMKFKIYALLGSSDFVNRFANVASYYKENDHRRFQLSAKIADLFDQYQLYRPEMIDKWMHSKSATDNEAEEWQQWLWNKLEVEPRSETRKKILAKLEKDPDLLKKVFPEISLFGITIFTRFHLDFINALEPYINIYFYISLPTIENVFKNNLLLSFGEKVRELSRMLKIDEFDVTEIANDTLLGRLQSEILHNKNDLEWIDDDSIQISSCYTAVREAECLYNYLLDLFCKDNTLKPGEVLVMTTDIDKYAPFVKAVFKNAPVKIPVRASGVRKTTEDSMLSCLESLLNFTEIDLTSEKVMSLLEYRRIRERFQIEDTAYVRATLKRANIRFGRENRSTDDTHYLGWNYGLEKILLGYAMLTEEEYQIDEERTLYPFSNSESAQSYDLLRLKAFVDKLEALIDAREELKSISDWKLFLFEDVIEEMIFHDDFKKKDREELSSIYRTMSYIDRLDFKDKIPFKVFLEELRSKLFADPQESKINTGAVTLSPAIPVRGLPYRVICFLGLNNDLFPGKDRFMGFDLLGEEYLQGDRSKKETDKYLFLDTLMAAQEKIYLSYIGQSEMDNAEIPRSVVVDTLLDHLGTESIVKEHPLHGFNSVYKKENDRMFTYLYGEGGTQTDSKESLRKIKKELSTYSFAKFFEHPIDWYFNFILGITYEEADEESIDTELFELNHLQKWFIKNDLVRLTPEEQEGYLKKAIKEGMLPLKNAGKVVLEDIEEEIAAVKSSYQSTTNGQKEKHIAIDLPVGDFRISGTIDSIYGDRFIAYSFSKNTKYQVRAFINSLLLFAGEKIKTALFISSDGEVVNFPSYSRESAISILKELIAFFVKGQEKPLKFSLKAYEFVRDETRADNIFKSEAVGNEYASVPANRYVRTLYNEGYFREFNADDLAGENDEAGIYDNEVFNEMKELARLLNL